MLRKGVTTMKKILLTACAAISAVLLLASCGSEQCNMCEKSCSSKHSYKDGEIVLCSSCYKKCFDDKTKVDADKFFETDAVEAEVAD